VPVMFSSKTSGPLKDIKKHAFMTCPESTHEPRLPWAFSTSCQQYLTNVKYLFCSLCTILPYIKNQRKILVSYCGMPGFVADIDNFVALKIVQSKNIFSTLTMKDDERKVVGNKVTIKVTNVRDIPWCKSYYGSDFNRKYLNNFLNINNERQQVIGNKVTIKVTNVLNITWCKSYYGSDYKTKSRCHR
jgi:hypothetical protein